LRKRGGSRNLATALVAQKVLGGELLHGGSYYNTHELKILGGRKWKFTYNGSIRYETKRGRIKEIASWLHSVELVKPVWFLDYSSTITRVTESLA
jgi:hypothetical protein